MPRLANDRYDRPRRWRSRFVALFIGAIMLTGTASHAPASDAESDAEWQSWTTGDHAPDELIGGIWSSRDQAFVSPSSLLQAVSEAQFILLGENHDNAAHHQLQAWIIRNASFSGSLTVVMEQIDASKAETLEAFLAQSDPDPVKLGETLDWANSGWPDWELYLPIASAAIDRQADILPGLPARSQTRRIAEEGFASLSADRLSALKLDQPLPEVQSEALRQEIAEAHCDLLPTQALPAMEAVQRFRDAYMAEAMLKAASKGPAILIAGNGHVERNRGVPWYLEQAGAEGVVVITLTETLPSNRSAPETSAIGDAADYIWFTTHVDRGDPCAALRERFKAD
jgi:uncharacterized iron-regulated protein